MNKRCANCGTPAIKLQRRCKNPACRGGVFIAATEDELRAARERLDDLNALIDELAAKRRATEASR